MTDVPDLLLPYQNEAIALSAKHDLLVIEKSRRTGITYGFAADAVLTAAAEHGGMDVFYIAYNLDMTREFIGYCTDFTKLFGQVAQPNEFLFDDGSEAGIKAFRIDYPSGHSIVALSSKPRSLRGKQGKIIIDEAAFHDQLDELLKAAIALLMWGGRIVVISTHDGADNPFNELIGEIREGRKRGYVMRLTLADALKQGLYRRICLRTGKKWSPTSEAAWEADLRRTYGDAADEELDVIAARGSGTYLARPAIERCQSASHALIRLTAPKDFETQDLDWRADWISEWYASELAPIIARFDRTRTSFFGQDFARSNDLSVVASGQYDDLSNLQARFVLEMRNVPFRAQKLLLDLICGDLPLFSAGKMDARGNGQQLAEDMAEDWGTDRIECVMASPKSYLAMMPRLKARIDDGTIVFPKSEAIVEDLRLIKLVKGVPAIVDRSADKADGAKGKRHGDAAIALMHLVAAADEDVGPFELMRLPGSRGSVPEMTVTKRGFGTVTRAADTHELRPGAY